LIALASRSKASAASAAMLTKAFGAERPRRFGCVAAVQALVLMF
jgi:hypothetical protein